MVQTILQAGKDQYTTLNKNNFMNKNKRKICFVITSKIHYSRSKLILEQIKNDKDLDLQIIVGASAIIPTYGDVLSLMKKDGYTHDAKIVMTLEGGSPVAMAKTTGIGITEFATAFDNLRPDVVVVRADRYEVLSAAVAAAYLNIPVAHIEGGDISGTIDESVRHAITKFAHIHFPSNEVSHQRILKMGENPDYVFNVGCAGIEYVSQHQDTITNEDINQVGVGGKIDLEQPYIMVMQHPVTSEFGDNRKNTDETLRAISKIGMQTLWFWPNVDAGSDQVSKAIRVSREKGELENVHFIKNLPAEKFIALLKNAKCLIGNSSAAIKECSYLGIPAVNIGTRQDGRLRGENVMDVDYSADQIENAIKKQLEHGPYEKSYIYHKEDTSKKIIEILRDIELYTQKRFHEK